MIYTTTVVKFAIIYCSNKNADSSNHVGGPYGWPGFMIDS